MDGYAISTGTALALPTMNELPYPSSKNSPIESLRLSNSILARPIQFGEGVNKFRGLVYGNGIRSCGPGCVLVASNARSNSALDE